LDVVHISRAERDIEDRDDVAAVEVSAVVVESIVEEIEDGVNFHEDAALSDVDNDVEELQDVVDFENAFAVAELNNDENVFDAAVAEKIVAG
jgi:hypothetical protein